MAWAVKYRLEFADERSVAWKIDVEEDAFSGSITELVGGEDPLVFKWDNDSDDVFDPIKTSQAVITMKASTDFLMADLYSIQDLQFRVRIYQNSVLYWTGYLMNNYSEPYECVPFDVTVTAYCGLEYLKESLYKYTTVTVDDTYYNGRILESQIIINILGKIGYTGFTEFVNIYEESMDDSVDDSPFDQILIDVDLFRDMYCYEVLQEILKKYNACIIHKNGGFVIYRPKELTGATVYGRVFTSSIVKSSTSFTSLQYINRTAHSTVFCQVPGGALITQRPAKKVNINQDYGNKESLIDNWQFNGDTFNGTDFESWAQYEAGTNLSIVSNSLGDGNRGVYIDSYDDASPYTKFIGQTFGTYILHTTNNSVIEFDYLLDNRSGVDVADTSFFIRLKQEAYFLNRDGYWKIGEGSMIAITQTAIFGGNGWQHYKLEITNGGILSGPITISLYATNKSDVRVAYRDVKYYFYSTEILQKTVKRKFLQRIKITGGYDKQIDLRNKYYSVDVKFKTDLITENTYIKTNAISGVELVYDYKLGDVGDANIDNILEQFAGSLYCMNTQQAHEFPMCFVRNEEMDNTLSLAASTKLVINNKTGMVITVNDLPNYNKFDYLGWVAMLCDEDKTNTSPDPIFSGDYLHKYFCTIDRTAKTLTFADGTDLSAWEVDDNLVLYNALLTYSFVGDQFTNPLINISGAPAWRGTQTMGGPMFRHSDGRFVWLFIGYQGTSPAVGRLGYAYSTDMISWTIGNSDNYVYAPTSLPDCNAINITGNAYPVDGSPGDYWCLICYGQASDNHGVHRILYFDEDFTTFSYSDKLMADVDLGFFGGSILKIGSYYHLIYMLITAAGVTYRSINAAKSLTLEGPYTNYQTNIVRGIDSNDGMCWQITDAPCIFDDGVKIFGLFGAQSCWSLNGLKGNRQYCLLDFDTDTEVWSANTNGPAFLNPFYYQDLGDGYDWCGDHSGGYPCIFIEGTDVYISCAMKGTVYQAALLKLNNPSIGIPTSVWNTRGGSESKPVLEIIGDEIADQYSRPKQLIQFPIKETGSAAMALNIIGCFEDSVNQLSGNNRKFVFNRGNLSAKFRKWINDLIEII